MKVDGVTKTVCGYAGGSATPTYASVCRGDDNVEAVHVEFDDALIAADAVLDAAFDCAKPSLNKRQYNPVVFVSGAADMAIVDAWRRKERRRADGLASTTFKVETATQFYVAERYHQGYWERWRPRYALLAFVVIAQTFATDLLGDLGNTAATILAVGIAAQTCYERLFDTDVAPIPIVPLSAESESPVVEQVS
ncbi:hypothetical protein CTAYLR_002449 [Chrysophaeum taylorii]|uniref:peptide-methionine (S)-S-oxide reductase n=1 Tax=Chrysophaeum taylorii TaxID=2483200 RepID=A0AAD7XTK0_9STRA|nr:hypothetical protein CTAYLR_002449 [Chrysophaeum taylorii]